MNDDFDFGQSNFSSNQFRQPGLVEPLPTLVDEPRGLVASGIERVSTSAALSAMYTQITTR